MRELMKVYNCAGGKIGDEFIDLSGLQQSTKEAILQIIYLDEFLSDTMEGLRQSANNCLAEGMLKE